MSQEIISEIKNHTGIITLKTEDGLNAVNRRMLAEIAEAATAMDMNDEVKAIIIRGGEKPFPPASTSTNSWPTSIPRCWKKCTRTLKNRRRQKAGDCRRQRIRPGNRL